MEEKYIDPKIYGLNPRVKLILLEPKHIGIIKRRKSRIIMKDAKQLLEIANAILKIHPDYNISILISGPVCSKSSKFLTEHHISLISE